MKAIIVEDNILVALQLEDIVASCGFEVVARTGRAKAALELVKAHKPDIVLLDLNLTTAGDGVALARELEALHPRPVLFVTGNPHLLDGEEFAVPNHVIAKPFRPAQIRQAVLALT